MESNELAKWVTRVYSALVWKLCIFVGFNFCNLFILFTIINFLKKRIANAM